MLSTDYHRMTRFAEIAGLAEGIGADAPRRDLGEYPRDDGLRESGQIDEGDDCGGGIRLQGRSKAGRK